MLQKFKRLFSKKSQESQERESFLPRNRFADLDFERVLKSGTRRLVDEEGVMQKMVQSQNLNFLKTLRNLNF